MAFEVSKRVVAESESTDRRPRPGVIEEVLRGDAATRRLGIASAGLMATRPSTPPRAAAREAHDAASALGTRHHGNAHPPEL
jgi:hypothetical protein